MPPEQQQLIRVYQIQNVTYHINETNPETLVVIATGLTTTSGWRNATLRMIMRDELSADGILDLELVATPPPAGTITLPALSPVTAEFTWQYRELGRMVAIKVLGRDNTGVTVWTNGGSPERGDITTYAIGEEDGGGGGGVTTMAVGEEGGGFTTMAIGEEGPHDPTLTTTAPGWEDPKVASAHGEVPPWPPFPNWPPNWPPIWPPQPIPPWWPRGPGPRPGPDPRVVRRSPFGHR